MNMSYFSMPFFLACLIASNCCFGAAHKYSQEFRAHEPYFYAVIAEAAYKHHYKSAQKMLDERLGSGVATALACWRLSLSGMTNTILVRDNNNGLHVGIEGSSNAGNWVGNAEMTVRGIVNNYDVSHGVRKKIHRHIKTWEKLHPDCTLVSIVGHSQGGMYASQTVRSHQQHYTKPINDTKKKHAPKQGRTTVVTFNCYKPIPRGNQFHFKAKKEHFATTLSSHGRYIPVNASGKHTSIGSNHGMKYILRGLKSATWEDFRKYSRYIK